MTGHRSGWRRPHFSTPQDVWTPGESAQLDALVSACALVALADGWVTSDERRSAMDRMRRLEAVSVFGIEEALAAFESLVDRFMRDPDDGVAVAEGAIVRLRGHAGPARLIIDAACRVAASDGAFDEDERSMVLRLCELFDLDPDSASLPAATVAEGMVPSA